MIRFACIQDPDWNAWFHAEVHTPGRQWLNENPERRPKDFWNHEKVQERVWTSFRMLCAYTAMYIGTSGEIDHFVSLHEDRNRAYDFDNYRYADPKFNRSKGKRRASELLDPFEVEDGWFEILIEANFQLVLTDLCPEPFRGRAETMLDKLHLRDHRRLIDARRNWYEQWEKCGAPIDLLDKYAPLVARAIRKG